MMKTSLIFLSVLLILLWYPHSGARNSQPEMGMEPQEGESARSLWEKAISAKGGRERLHGVRSFVVSSKSKYSRGPKDMPGDQTETLYVLPDKLWEWQDIPGPLGVHITVLDFDRHVGWELSDKWDSAKPITAKSTMPNPGDSQSQTDDLKFRSIREKFVEAQLIYLMETRFLTPSLIRSRKAKLGSTRVDVIETSVGRERIEYYLDPRTHLPQKIAIITRLESGRDYMDVIRLSAYASVNGIMMPQRVAWGSDEENKTSYQINVNYDPGIFERAPTIHMGADAWRRN